ncbi:uncharacterized protein [Amphiura filiformis]|uniref:uncharacterized protein n=1 Tax=Amphiura filiformis TaxID=82378 RepID=UPI003B210BDF
MATAYLENAEADLSCPLCLELFVDPNTPKQLDCPHVYCQKCLTEMVKGDVCVITCPECRMETRVPVSEGGVSALRTSLRLRNLAENHRKQTEKPSTTETGHTKSKVPTCPAHDDEKLHFYCVTCKVLVCQACVLLEHDKSTHEIKGVKAIYTEKLQQMKDRIQNANDEAKKNEHSVQQVLQLTKQGEESTAVTEKEIDRAMEVAHAKVNESGKALKIQLTELNQKHLLGYQKQKEDLERANQALGDMVAEAGSVMEATPYEYVAKHDQLEEKFEATELVEERKKEGQATTFYKLVSEQVSSLGKLVPVRKMNRTQAIVHDTQHIGGGNGVLAVRQLNTLFTYNKQATDKYKHKLEINVEDACDVAVTPTGKYMVATPTSVEVFDPRGQHEGTFSETKGKDNVKNKKSAKKSVGNVVYQSISDTVKDRRSSIAVLSDGRVIVGNTEVIEGNAGTINNLAVFRHDGTKVKNINLCCIPRSLAAMKGSQVALCDLVNRKVYVWDLDTEKEVLSVSDIPDVRCVCYDVVSDCLMIGSGMQRGRKGKIEQYSISPWKLITTMDTEDVPIAMNFADTNELAVVFEKNGYMHDAYEINVYKCID